MFIPIKIIILSTIIQLVVILIFNKFLFTQNISGLRKCFSTYNSKSNEPFNMPKKKSFLLKFVFFIR
jgi:hypothetical protein